MGALTATVLLLGSLLLAVGVDVHLNDQNFEKSFTGKKLKEYGGFEYGLLAYEQAAFASNKTAQWVADNVPLYLNATSQHLKPYAKLGRDLSLIALNVGKRVALNIQLFYSENYPAIEKWGQENLPVVREYFYSAANATKEGATLVFNFAKTQGANAAQFLRTNVFVGNLSPENLQKYTMEAYNTTQVLASNTFSWVYEKVRTISN